MRSKRRICSPTSERCWSPKSASLIRPPSSVTITHPYHPLHGQKLELVCVPKNVNSKLLVRHPTGRSFRIPRDWTDFENPQVKQPQAAYSPLLDISGLRAAARIISTMKNESLALEEADS